VGSAPANARASAARSSTSRYYDPSRNAASTPFAGWIRQYFAGGGGTALYVRGSIKDYSGTTADGIHAPN
jgi:hypothetical protein